MDSNERPAPSGMDVFVATGALAGFAPIAPGTVGAIWGIPLALAVRSVPGETWRIAITLALCLAGVPLCTRVAKKLGKKDPGAIVWDEIASMPLVFLFVSDNLLWKPWILIAGFALHRVFDISKLPPTSWLERLPDGAGIMADDISAALYGCVFLHLLIWLIGLAYGSSPMSLTL